MSKEYKYLFLPIDNLSSCLVFFNSSTKEAKLRYFYSEVLLIVCSKARVTGQFINTFLNICIDAENQYNSPTIYRARVSIGDNQTEVCDRYNNLAIPISRSTSFTDTEHLVSKTPTNCSTKQSIFQNLLFSQDDKKYTKSTSPNLSICVSNGKFYILFYFSRTIYSNLLYFCCNEYEKNLK